MKVSFNNRGNLRNLGSFIREIDLSNPSELLISCSSTSVTIHPANLVLAAALAKAVGASNTHVSGDDSVLRLMSAMGLYDFLGIKPTFESPEPAGKYIPLATVTSPDEQARLISDIVPLLHVAPKNARLIKYVLSELIRNTLEHALSPYGALVSARYTAESNTVSLAICDGGRGIWGSMDDNWHPKTDLDAIKLALAPGISGTTRHEGGTMDNAGAGLFYVKSMAKISRNYFAIYSGTGFYQLLKERSDLENQTILRPDPTKDRANFTNDMPRLNGTMVAVDITMDESQPEFADLMSEIGRVYDEEISRRKKENYRKPRFI